MKTILWKELREHARWVPLGAILIITILMLEWWSTDLVFDAQEYGSSLALGSLVAIAASAIAVCLGVLQSWPDQRPAARALLLHRGITANAAFCGKLLAGLLLYAAAVFAPLLAMAAFIAAVGIEHRAASPSALLPAALMSVCAFSCWPAAMLVVQRDARVIGSYLLPGLTAGLAVFACAALMNYVLWLVVVITVFALACFLAGARSAFVNSSQVATGSGRVAIAVVVTVALLMANMFMMAVVEYFQRIAIASNRVAVYHNYPVEFGPDGKPWLTRAVYSNQTYAYEADQVAPMVPGRSVRDQLQPVPEGWKPLKKWTPHTSSTYDMRFGQRFVHICSVQVPLGGAHVTRLWILDRSRDVMLVYRVGADARYQLEATLSPPAEAGSFGELGPCGQDSKGANSTLVTSTGVFSLPGHGATVEFIYAWPSTSRLLGSEIADRRDPKTAFGLLARFEDRAVLLEGTSEGGVATGAKSVGEFPGLGEVFATEIRLPEKIAEAQLITLARDPASDDAFVATAQNYREDWNRINWMRFDTAGQIKEQADYDNSSGDIVTESSHAVAAFIPPGTFLVGFVVMAIETNQDMGVEYIWNHSTENPKDTASFVGFFALQPLIGIPLALWAARRRRLDKRRTRWWLLWAFFYGPCGGLAILAAYVRIAHEPCPACHKLTRIDSANCEHCRHPLDDTPRTGVEIFDNDRNVVRETRAAASI